MTIIYNDMQGTGALHSLSLHILESFRVEIRSSLKSPTEVNGGVPVDC